MKKLLICFTLTFAFLNATANDPNNGTKEELQFKEDVLLYQNSYRQIHKAPPLKLNTTLSDMAADWASTVAENDKIKPSSVSKHTDIEESLCMVCGFNYTGYNVTLEWYRQACLYDFKNHEKMPDRVGGVKNFERMVWKSAKEFGIGRARSHNLPCTYIIGWYNPILGTAEENVVQGEFRGRECLKVSKNPEKYLHDSDRSRRKIFLCGESAAVLREKACAHFGCKSGMFVRQKI